MALEDFIILAILTGIILVGILIPIRRGYLEGLTDWRKRHRRCLRCEYPLKSLAIDGDGMITCAECGHLNPAAAFEMPRIPSSACALCGHNLRSATINADCMVRCPMCSQSHRVRYEPVSHTAAQTNGPTSPR